MEIIGLKTPIFEKENDLFSFFCDAVESHGITLQEKSVLILSSKVVAVSQGRIVRGTKDEIEKWVRKESDEYWPTNYPKMFLTITSGIFIANAGIDASNARKGELILWPKKPWEFAESFRKKILNKYSLKEFGVLISDSRCTPLRTGITGVALAWSGFVGIDDMRGKVDLFGNAMEVTQNAVADNLSCTGELVMGNTNESTPFVLCSHPPIVFTGKKQDLSKVVFPIEDDIFYPLWGSKPLAK